MLGPLGLTLGLFAAWWLVGLALLAAVGADARELRLALVAPALGTCATVLPAFVCSRLGIPLDDAALPIAIAVGAAGAAVLVVRRPAVHPGVLLVLGICLAGLLLAGAPMLDLGWRWLANGNSDMTAYALGASRLLHHGFSAPLDVTGFVAGRDYATTQAFLIESGLRPGSQITIAFAQALTGRAGYEVYMPIALALHLTGLCAVGALALQLAKRWWAAAVAAALLAVAPLATYGVLQQLMPQIWGLALLAALSATLMRPELHRRDGGSPRDALLVGVLGTGLVLVYVELLPIFLAAYGLYVARLLVRREVEPRTLLRLWVPAALVAVLVLNVYLVKEVRVLVDTQASQGASSTSVESLAYGYLFVPSGLTTVPGLQALPASANAPALDLSILVAAAYLAAALVVAAVGTWRGGAAGMIVLVEAGLAVFLVARRADFGVFKLTMYAQPFLAAAAAAWLAEQRTRVPAIAAGSAALVALTAVGLSTQRVYVDRSRHPLDVRDASSKGQLPTFRAILDAARGAPVVSATDNVFLIQLQGLAGQGREVRFLSQQPFYRPFTGRYLAGTSASLRRQARRLLRESPVGQRTFPLGSAFSATFTTDARAGTALGSNACVLVLPTGTQSVFNRRSLPEGSSDLLARPCADVHDQLAFVVSSVGQHYYLFGRRSAVSFYQLESDYFYPGRTFTAFGRYALLRLVHPTPGVRLELWLTTTVRHDRANRLPPVAVVGGARQALPLEGRGSARVFSAPLRVLEIGGAPYAMLDLGADGRIAAAARTGLQALYGKREATDPRYVVAYVRDVSLVGAAALATRRPPAALHAFPADLGNPDVEYAGLYEDGWVGERANAVLAGGTHEMLVVEGSVPRGPARRLDVLVDGRRVARRTIAPGVMRVRVPVIDSLRPRRVELHFDGADSLPAPDLRPVSARLSYLGFAPSSSSRKRLRSTPPP